MVKLENLQRYLEKQRSKLELQERMEALRILQQRKENATPLEKIVIPHLEQAIQSDQELAMKLIEDLVKIDPSYSQIKERLKTTPDEFEITSEIREATASLVEKMRLGDRIAEEVLDELQLNPSPLSRENLEKVLQKVITGMEKKIEDAGLSYYPMSLDFSFTGERPSLKVENHLLRLLISPTNTKELSNTLQLSKSQLEDYLRLLSRYRMIEENLCENRKELRLTPKGAAFIVGMALKPHIARQILELCEEGIAREDLVTSLLASGVPPTEIEKIVAVSENIQLIKKVGDCYTVGPLGELYRQNF